jgi:hypothetical protein
LPTNSTSLVNVVRLLLPKMHMTMPMLGTGLVHAMRRSCVFLLLTGRTSLHRGTGLSINSPSLVTDANWLLPNMHVTMPG